MKIAVIETTRVTSFPPCINLVGALLDLGNEVCLLAYSVDEMPERISSNCKYRAIDLGSSVSRQEKLMRSFDTPHKIRRFIEKRGSEFDVIWTLSDYAARAAGKILLKYRHIMSMAELVEYTPAFFRRRMPLHSRTTVELARHAARVVVPEYNRAHIQKVWWNLPRVPAVLPNKPYPDYRNDMQKAPKRVKQMLESETRRILLYQGVYTKDRDLSKYAEALEILGDDYALYLMGKATTGSAVEIERLCSSYSNVHDLGFIPAPGHLSVTPYGHIGLLPYVASQYGANSVLNPLYCAPNKIWEYSGFGLPMLGSDVPGLAYPFQRFGMGETSDGSPTGIAKAVRRIESDYARYSERAKKFYDSVDVKSIVSQILDEAGA